MPKENFLEIKTKSAVILIDHKITINDVSLEGAGEYEIGEVAVEGLEGRVGVGGEAHGFFGDKKTPAHVFLSVCWWTIASMARAHIWEAMLAARRHRATRTTGGICTSTPWSTEN